MISVLSELLFGILLFVGAIVLIPRLLSGDKEVYEIAVPFAVILLLSVILIINLNLSLLIAAVGATIIYQIRSRRR